MKTTYALYENNLTLIFYYRNTPYTSSNIINMYASNVKLSYFIKTWSNTSSSKHNMIIQKILSYNHIICF